MTLPPTPAARNVPTVPDVPGLPDSGVLTPFTDSLGVAIYVGDRVVINSWGSPVRVHDVGVAGTVTGWARTRLRVEWDKAHDAPWPRIGGGHVGVLRRDGTPGAFEGNLGR